MKDEAIIVEVGRRIDVGNNSACILGAVAGVAYCQLGRNSQSHNGWAKLLRWNSSWRE